MPAPKKKTATRTNATAASAVPIDSPWLRIADAAGYTHVSHRLLRREIKRGALRAAIVGGRNEILTRRQWLDDWLEGQARATPFPVRSRVG